MRVARLHPWKVSVTEAFAIQERLRLAVEQVPLGSAARLVAAADVAYSRPTHRMYAVVVVLDLGSGSTVETVRVVRHARFPYIPGLFSFREAPALVAAFERMRSRPDVVLFDGQGLAHPRRFGLACHLGVLLGLPSIGCAKSRLTGEHQEVGPKKGDWVELRDRGEIIGAVVRTRDRVRPVFVSVGHRVSLEDAIATVLGCTTGFRLPEPIRLAHNATNALMRERDPRLARVDQRTYPDLVKRARS